MHILGTREASEALIFDLYIDLKKKVNMWSDITKQTAQARMGYIGQHLVSVVTGYPGGRSGARGKDLVISETEFGEIKTCYRVDQLGKCNQCGAAVSSIEPICPSCESNDIKRNDDSKWLISIRNDDEFEKILDPKFYYLVLFEFEDLSSPDKIVASIWRVDPFVPGFSLCMIDYYLNIRSKSKSKAPFNLWPHQLKFHLMHPTLIYRSIIDSDDVINTLLFPGLGSESIEKIKPSQYSRATIPIESLVKLCNDYKCPSSITPEKKLMLKFLDNLISGYQVADYLEFIDSFAIYYYGMDLDSKQNMIPDRLLQRVRDFLARCN